MLLAAAVWFALRPLAGAKSQAAGFRDVTRESGINFHMMFLPGEQGESFKINLYDHGAGLAVADVDGDGCDDVLFLNQLGANALYRNCGDGTFDDVTAQAGAVALRDRVCVGAAFGDYDNDGDQDLYITSTRGGNVLLENLGGGRFRDVTARAGVGCVAHSQTPAFFDYDNDGDLDLFVTNTAHWTSDKFVEASRYYAGPKELWDFVDGSGDFESNVLYRNDGQGRFTDLTDEAGLRGKGWSGDVAVFDFDEDGDLDLFVAHMWGLSQLYGNDGGRFREVTRDTLRRTAFGAIGSKAFDFNNDGRLDLFVADMHSDMWLLPNESPLLVEPSKKYRFLSGPKPETSEKSRADERATADSMGIDYSVALFGNALFRNEGGGRFEEVSDAAGLETFWPWGVATGDFDNDGHEDLFLPSGMGYPFFYWPCSCLMRNRGDGTFINVAPRVGMEPPLGGDYLADKIGNKAAARSSRCAVTADFDGDGRLDLMVNNFNDRPFYFKNQLPARHYITFRLRGTYSNRDAIGATVKLFAGDSVMIRQVHCTGGYLSQSSKTLHFGLGDSTHIDRAEIRWPRGTRQTIESPTIDRLHEIAEPGPT